VNNSVFPGNYFRDTGFFVIVDLQAIPSSQNAQPLDKGASKRTLRLHRRITAIEAIDPWIALSAFESEPGPVFAWSDPFSGIQFHARGRVARLQWDDANRFDRANQFCSHLRELLHDASPSPEDTSLDLPLVIGGFSFADRKPLGAWKGWSATELWVPEQLLWTDGRSSYVVDYSLGFEPAPVNEELIELLSGLATVGDEEPSEDATSRESGDDEALWGVRIQQALQEIEAGAIQKVVLARSIDLLPGARQIFSARSSIETLRAEHNHCTSFLVRLDGQESFLGASPETLLRRCDGRIESVALAGTASRSTLEAETLQTKTKDREEHRLVVEAMGEQLGNILCLDEVADEPRLRTLKDLVHLETTFRADAPESVDIFSILEALHPTPAVGGLPVQQAMEWIDQREGLERGWYSGPVGWVGAHGDAHFVVAIRSVLMHENSALSFTGAGIIEGSTAEGEWAETQAKSRTVVQSLRTKSPLGSR
jgi:isochorismate synthase